jgi:hypothetical protein
MSRQTSQDPRTAWTFERPSPPPGIRVFNWIGRIGHRLGWRRRLSVDRILEGARHRTGLLDWGNEAFLEPLEILVRAFEEEADLTAFGRRFIGHLLTGRITNRLILREYLRQHPEILEAPLAPPLIVVGMPRTGTTLLYNLLAQDPDARALLGWESLLPAPLDTAPGYRKDTRVTKSRMMERGLRRIAPALEHIHPFHPEGPEECTWLMATTLVSPIFSMLGRIPSYDDWLWGLEPAAWAQPYQEYVEQLLVLQHQTGDTRRWVLKSPVHYMSLGPLLEKIPEARVVLTDRDPRQVVPSACSLFAVLRGTTANSVNCRSLGPDLVRRLSEGLSRAEQARQRHPDRVLKIDFRTLVTNKTGTVRRIYEHFGLALSPEAETAMTRWIQATPYSGSHKYSLEQFGISESVIQRHFSDIRS